MLSWLRIGRVWAAVSVLALVVMQAVAGQWFPPPISLSQYGIGPWGWIFSIWAVAVSTAPLCLWRALPDRRWFAALLLAIGFVGAVVMAAVRTDAGAGPASWHAVVHTTAAVVALWFIPFGTLAVLWPLGGRAQAIGLLLTVFIFATLGLLLLAAAGFDTAGMGAARSWAFWQSVAVTGGQVLVLLLAISIRQPGNPVRDVVKPVRDEESHTPRGA